MTTDKVVDAVVLVWLRPRLQSYRNSLTVFTHAVLLQNINGLIIVGVIFDRLIIILVHVP